MIVEQLMKIKEKLKKYNLLEKIEDIGEWLSKLNDRQINNLLELNIDSNIASQNAKYILDLELKVPILKRYCFVQCLKRIGF